MLESRVAMPFEFAPVPVPASRLLISRRVLSLCWLVPLVSSLSGCQKASAVSAARAKENLVLLTSAIGEDLAEIRRGLPRGAELLEEYFHAGRFEDAVQAREVLERTRGKVQDLRVAKATFFALVDPGGVVLRTDQGSDLIAGKSLFAAFPELKKGVADGCVEARGELPEASRVRGRSDGQWVIACPVRGKEALTGIYAAGWSWSAYAYRLENHLRASLRSALKHREREALVYVYLVVEKQLFYAPISPDVIARTLAEQNLLARAHGTEPLVLELEITGREFGAAFTRVEGLGKDVGVVVLRSET